MQIAILLVAAGLFATAAWGDVRARRIANGLPLGIAALAVLRMAAAGDLASAAYTAAAGLAVFVIGYVLFLARVVGGGDVKLTAAAVLLVGHRDLLAFLLVMSLAGAAISLALLAKLAAERRARAAAVAGGTVGALGEAARPTVPYGAAIAVSGVAILFLQTFHIG